MAGTLYVVATPIGNLKDISFRAVETLKAVDLIACEDTRRTAILLNTYGVTTPTTSYHAYSGPEKSRRLVEEIRGGKRVALVSDAGSPALSDPGYRLVRELWLQPRYYRGDFR